MFGGYTLCWRPECDSRFNKKYKKECNHVDKDLVLKRLEIALYKNLITASDFKELKEKMNEYYFPENPYKRTPIPNFGEPYNYLLIRSGILMQYREELSVNIIAWICAFIPNIAILFSGYLRGILIDNFNIFFLFSIAVSIVPSYFILRMIWNKRCKKEWLPDEALAFVAHGLGLALILSILFCTIYIPIMMIQFELHLKYVLLFYGFIFGSFIFCKVLLKLTARKPYKGSSFCFQ